MLIDLMDAFITREDADAAYALIDALPDWAAPETLREEYDLLNAILWSVYGDEIEALI